jgi:hypothetical protein
MSLQLAIWITWRFTYCVGQWLSYSRSEDFTEMLVDFQVFRNARPLRRLTAKWHCVTSQKTWILGGGFNLQNQAKWPNLSRFWIAFRMCLVEFWSGPEKYWLRCNVAFLRLQSKCQDNASDKTTIASFHLCFSSIYSSYYSRLRRMIHWRRR